MKKPRKQRAINNRATPRGRPSEPRFFNKPFKPHRVSLSNPRTGLMIPFNSLDFTIQAIFIQCFPACISRSFFQYMNLLRFPKHLWLMVESQTYSPIVLLEY